MTLKTLTWTIPSVCVRVRVWCVRTCVRAYKTHTHTHTHTHTDTHTQGLVYVNFFKDFMKTKISNHQDSCAGTAYVGRHPARTVHTIHSIQPIVCNPTVYNPHTVYNPTVCNPTVCNPTVCNPQYVIHSMQSNSMQSNSIQSNSMTSNSMQSNSMTSNSMTSIHSFMEVSRIDEDVSDAVDKSAAQSCTHRCGHTVGMRQ